MERAGAIRAVGVGERVNSVNVVEGIRMSLDLIPDIVITTSEYHKVRAEKIFNGIFKDASFKIQPKWNLGSKACPTCWVDESIHMVNVNNDVNKAIAKNKV